MILLYFEATSTVCITETCPLYWLLFCALFYTVAFVDCDVSRTTIKLFVCDLVTCVLNWGKIILDVWFILRWPYVVDGSKQLIASVLPSVCVCSVRFKVVSMRLEKPICAPPRLSEASPPVPLKRFQWSSDWRWPCTAVRVCFGGHHQLSPTVNIRWSTFEFNYSRWLCLFVCSLGRLTSWLVLYVLDLMVASCGIGAHPDITVLVDWA